MKLHRDKISLTLLIPEFEDFTLAHTLQVRRGSSLVRRTQKPPQRENEKRATKRIGRAGKREACDKRIKRFFGRHKNGVDYVFYEDLTEAVTNALSSRLIMRET